MNRKMKIENIRSRSKRRAGDKEALLQSLKRSYMRAVGTGILLEKFCKKGAENG